MSGLIQIADDSHSEQLPFFLRLIQKTECLCRWMLENANPVHINAQFLVQNI
jgi:hypothetical protein